jgi:FAD/FMN-containing dehydrogenase
MTDHSPTRLREEHWSDTFRPRDAGQLEEVIREAGKTRTPLVPRSSGPRHRSGGSQPHLPEACLVDMSEMRGIVRVDRRNRAALVEAGVTFGPLVDELSKAGLRANMPLCPRASKSAVASALEREPIIMPRYQWDLVDPLMSLEIVFGTGDLFRAGSGAGPGTLEEQWASGQSQKSPMGPSQFDPVRLIQGAQGTLGVVTWASLRVEQKPSEERLVFVGSKDLADLVRLVYHLMHRRLGEECFILNASALASLAKTEPGDIDSFKRSSPAWVLVLGFAGFELRPRERIDYQLSDAGELMKALGLEPRDSLDGLTSNAMQSMIRKPSGEPYWKDRRLGASREIFFLTTMDRAEGCVEVMRDAARKYGYPEDQIGVYLQPLLGGRAAHLEFLLPHSPGEEIDALFDDASLVLLDTGAYFSRPYGAWADLVWGKDPEMHSAVERIKRIFDPLGIMNPGQMGLGVV